MPDNDSHKIPIPKVMTVAEFFQRFGDQDACHEHLKTVRWGHDLERFACPDCGHTRGWWLPRRQLVECADCHRQTSVTAGTIMHGVRTPLWKWLWAIYQLAHDKKGIAAMELSKQVRVCYETAWTMLHKIRAAMGQRDQRYTLQGLVEVDECYVGGKETGRIGRGAETKSPVAVAVELNVDGKPRHVAMRAIERADAVSLRKFAECKIEKGATLKTDGWGAYRSVAKAGYEHVATVTGGGSKAAETFPWLHTFIGNMKRMILGTYHSVSRKHLNHYLAEFDYRANRRWGEQGLFDRLVIAAVSAKPLTFKKLTTGAT